MIKLKIYDTTDDYKGKKIKIEEDIDISMSDLKRYAVSLGSCSGYNITKNGEMFYHYLLQMSLEEDASGQMKYFKIGKDYKNAEASIKNSISFFMGMIAAKAVAEKKYKVSHLYHLTDKIIISTPAITQTSQAGAKTEKKFRPDFFGVNDKDEGILFEAKGTVSIRPEGKTIEHAKEQIRNINCVTLKNDTSNQKYDNYQLKGYVVASSFDKNDLLVYHCIDPSPKGEKEIVIDLGKAMILYYQHIMNFLIRNHDALDEYDSRFVISEYGLYKIGIEKEIYEVLEKYRGIYDGSEDIDTVERRTLIKDCKEISSCILNLQDSALTEKMSLGLDGIICG